MMMINDDLKWNKNSTVISATMIDSSIKVCFKVSIALSMKFYHKPLQLQHHLLLSAKPLFYCFNNCMDFVYPYNHNTTNCFSHPHRLNQLHFLFLIRLIFTTAISFIFKGMLFIVFIVVFSISSTDF